MNKEIKKTKIVATIGPASESEEIMTKLVKSGMNVIRNNLSHGNHEEHESRIKLARKISEKLNSPVAILMDLSGPKIRIGDFIDGEIKLKEKSKFILSTTQCEGTDKKVFVNYSELHKEVKSGSIIFLNDGKVKLQVESVSGKEIHCIVLTGGSINGRRGVNIPGAYLKISSLTSKDKEDVKFGIKNDVDFIALSFVRKASDVLELKEILKKYNSNIKIIAKIETEEALENLDEIIKVSDGIMVARGDLAVEIPPEKVPIVQKTIIKKCNNLGKPVITATQMLSSMVNSPTPTRAEVADIANAILDGTDAVMLSEETTIGKYPLEAVQVMSRVAYHTESNFQYEKILQDHHLAFKNETDSLSYAVVNTAHDLNARAIIALSVSGFTGRMMARYRPKRPVIVITPDKKSYNFLSLSFNTYPIYTTKLEKISEALDRAKQIAKEHGFVKKGDCVVIAAGIPFKHSPGTNMMVVQNIE